MRAPAPREGLVTRDNKLVLVSVLVNSIPYGYMNVVPLVYLLEVGYSPATIGIIYSVGAVTGALGQIPFGILADRIGRKIFMILGSIIPSISYAIFGLTLNPFYLVIAGIIGGVGLGGGFATSLSNPSLFPLLASSTTNERRTTVFGLLEGAWISAQAIGSTLSFLPTLLSLTFSQSSTVAHAESYLLMSALMIVSTIPLLFVNENTVRAPTGRLDLGTSSAADHNQNVETNKASGSLRPPVNRHVTLHSTVVKFCFIYAMAGLGVGVLVQVIPTWYNLRFGVSETEIGTWIALAQLTSLIGLPLIPKIARRGTVNASAGAGLLAVTFLGLMPLAGQFSLAASLFMIRSFWWTISWPVLQSYMVGVVNERARATVSGIAYTAFVAVMALGTFAGEAFLGAGLLTLPFVVGGAGYLGSAAGLLFFFRKLKPPEEATVVGNLGNEVSIK